VDAETEAVVVVDIVMKTGLDKVDVDVVCVVRSSCCTAAVKLAAAVNSVMKSVNTAVAEVVVGMAKVCVMGFV